MDVRSPEEVQVCIDGDPVTPPVKTVSGNYRICFGGTNVNYHRNFHACRRMFPTIDKLLRASRQNEGVSHLWWFFEPYAEVTWMSTDETFLETAKQIVEEDGYTLYWTKTPDDGYFANWYGADVREQIYGTYYYAACANASAILLKNQEGFEDGIGLKNHYGRLLHTLANQQGLNYWHEGVACVKHGLLCLGVYFFKPTWIRDFCTKYLHMSSGLFFK